MDQHCYTLTMIGTHGLYLDTPRHVRVEGLTVTGFTSAVGLPYGQQTLWATYGIFIENGKRSVISDSQAYLNGRGIGTSNESENRSQGVCFWAVKVESTIWVKPLPTSAH